MAASWLLSPSWLATMVQSPAPRMATVVPSTVQTSVVVLAKPTARFEVAVPPTVKTLSVP
ncbi:MAG: hypothetical protein U0232_01330 [Thermomicrobiales bacterium]